MNQIFQPKEIKLSGLSELMASIACTQNGGSQDIIPAQEVVAQAKSATPGLSLSKDKRSVILKQKNGQFKIFTFFVPVTII